MKSFDLLQSNRGMYNVHMYVESLHIVRINIQYPISPFRITLCVNKWKRNKK